MRWVGDETTRVRVAEAGAAGLCLVARGEMRLVDRNPAHTRGEGDRRELTRGKRGQTSNQTGDTERGRPRDESTDWIHRCQSSIVSLSASLWRVACGLSASGAARSSANGARMLGEPRKSPAAAAEVASTPVRHHAGRAPPRCARERGPATAWHSPGTESPGRVCLQQGEGGRVSEIMTAIKDKTDNNRNGGRGRKPRQFMWYS